MAKKLSPVARKRRKEKRIRCIKIGIPVLLGTAAAALLIWYSCYLFGWVKYTPFQVMTGKNKPYCVVSGYKGLTYTGESAGLTDEDYENYYKSMLQETPNYIRNEKRDATLVRDGDAVNIDFAGKINGEAFDGGTGKDYFLVIGSGTFVPGFEDALIGVTVGDTVDIAVTFPEEYYEDLAGKPAVFTVTVNYVADELDEITDAYIARNTEYSDRTAYEEQYLTAYLQEKKEASVKESQYSEVLNALISNTEYHNLDEEINSYYDSMLQYYTEIASGLGASLESYINYTQGTTLAQFQADLSTLASITVKEQYALRYVAKQEKLKVTDDIYNQYIEQVMDENGYTDKEKFEAAYDKDYIKDMILMTYALDKVFSYAEAK